MGSSPLSDVEDKADLMDACLNDLENLLITEDYVGVEKQALACKTTSLEYSQALDRVDTRSLDPKTAYEISARRLEPSAADALFDAMHYLAKGLQRSDAGDFQGFLDHYSAFSDSVDDAIYYIFRIKTEHPSYYKEDMELSGATETELLLEFSNLYQLRNQMATDISQNELYSYFYNVDPQDNAVVYVTDSLLDGVYDDDARRNMLLDYVRKNVKYKHDPNWYLDWPMPPAYTLLAGTGDCDDMSILLASMMKRAGVSNVELCLADSTYPYDDGYDHMTVGINAGDGWYVYEGTCDSCAGTAPDDVSEWSIACSGIEEFLMGIDEATPPPDISIDQAISEGRPVYCHSENVLSDSRNHNVFFEGDKCAIENWEENYVWMVFDGERWFKHYLTEDGPRKWFDASDELSATCLQVYENYLTSLNDGEITLECGIVGDVTDETFSVMD